MSNGIGISEVQKMASLIYWESLGLPPSEYPDDISLGKSIVEMYKTNKVEDDDEPPSLYEDEEVSIKKSGFVPASSVVTIETCLLLMTKEHNRRAAHSRFNMSGGNMLELCNVLFRVDWQCLKQRRDFAMLRDKDTILDLYVSRLRWCVCVQRSSSDISDEMAVQYYMKEKGQRTSAEFMFHMVDRTIVMYRDIQLSSEMFSLLFKGYSVLEADYADHPEVSLTHMKYALLVDFIATVVAELDKRNFSVMRCDCMFEMLSLLAFESRLALEGVEFYKRRMDDDFVHDLEILYREKLLTLSCREALQRTKYASQKIKSALLRLFAVDA